MFRYLIFALAVLHSGGALAVGCKEAPRFGNSPTVTVLNASPENPRPGDEITLTALVEAADVFSVSCQNPDHSVQRIGGIIDVFAGATRIGSVQIAPENTHQVYLGTYYDPACPQGFTCPFFYYGFNTTSYSVKFRMPMDSTQQTFTASFSGDKHFSRGSNSQPLNMSAAYADNSPIISYLLN
ncbi:hypothetical protein IEQ11_16235 [Lysobacter capsici]|jgi:hypothetical protein|uniref:hypothetical protein n=1 Tax=Lysobacter capsici TaxID=435897 RepID=UPI000720F6E6|nr:hypothetical protein [Lysobacter capsici]ALN86769.1 hypothetical protein LC55x_3512 [Lysobacter capsici]UOF13288.1 hypothetical protein IEQ11_16235 [Lysobacter capsici]